MACEVLGDIAGVERVWNLPRGGPFYAATSGGTGKPSAWRQLSTRAIERVVLRDRWGKMLITHRLDGYQSLKVPERGLAKTGPLEILDPTLQLVRCRRGEGGLTCQMSDGSEIVCTGVIFADGAGSKARELMQKLEKPKADPSAVACWSFVRSDLLNLKSWEFRTALGKSVEQLPLPDGQVRVKLRFKSRFGSRQTVLELKSLFSEFGSDMESLFEGVSDDQIEHWIEQRPAVSFCPVPGTLAMGDAALGVPLLDTFDWARRLAKRQLERAVESLISENWDPESWEPASQEALEPLLRSEKYLRDALHYDNALLRPIRDFAMRMVPSGVLVDRVKGRLIF